MPVKFGFDNPFMMTWLLLHQNYNLISKCEEKVFREHGITTEQHAVLMSIKFIQGPVTPTEVAKWLDRNVNSVSLIADRMVKAGLVRKKRDLRDRRLVRLIITDKGMEVLERATAAGWLLIQEMLSGLSGEELRALIRLLGNIREKANGYLNPGEELEVIMRDESSNMASFLKRVDKYYPDPAPH